MNNTPDALAEIKRCEANLIANLANLNDGMERNSTLDEGATHLKISSEYVQMRLHLIRKSFEELRFIHDIVKDH